MNTKKALAINSILIVISTTIIATILHECAHFLTGQHFNLNPELHHNYVKPLKEGTALQQAIMAAAGPLFSLVFGCLVLFISFRLLNPSLFRLFMTWLGMGSILGLLGYLLITPIAKDGDTGKVFAYLGIPTPVSIIIAVLSFIAINYLFGKCASQFVFYKPEGIFNKQDTQIQLFKYPIYASIIIMTLLSFPIVSWVSLLPTIFMPMGYFKTLGDYKKTNPVNPTVTVDKVSPTLIAVTIITIILFRYLV